MKVFIDYQVFEQTIGGVSRVIIEILKHLTSDVKVICGISVSDNLYIRDFYFNHQIKRVPLTKKNFILSRNFRGKSRLFDLVDKYVPFIPTFNNINRPISIKLLKKGDFDIFHCPITDGSDYFLPYIIGKKPFVLTVHDMISELFCKPGEPQSVLKKKLVKYADHIIVISECTKKDLKRLLNVPDEKITVIYHGSPEVHTQTQRLVKEDYFLYVGRRDGYKNCYQTLEDFKQFHNKHNNIKLVLVGFPLTKEEQKFVNELGLASAVQTILATEEELASLYSYAIAFIYPSLYEGFGLPILEAFTNKCLLLCNNSSSLPEIADDAAIYFESKPGCSNLPQKLEEVYKMDDGNKMYYINKGLKRLAFFSWEKAAKQTEMVYRSVINRYKNK